MHLLFPLPGALFSQILAQLALPLISGLGSNVTSSEGPALSVFLKEPPGHGFLTLLNFLDSTYDYLELHLFAYLLVCLALKIRSFL